jgi:hypothetical protein
VNAASGRFPPPVRDRAARPARRADPAGGTWGAGRTGRPAPPWRLGRARRPGGGSRWPGSHPLHHNCRHLPRRSPRRRGQPDSGDPTVWDERGACGKVSYWLVPCGPLRLVCFGKRPRRRDGRQTARAGMEPGTRRSDQARARAGQAGVEVLQPIPTFSKLAGCRSRRFQADHRLPNPR